MSIAENKARYEQSGLKVLMDAAHHTICERCYCCDVIFESATCWSCGGFDEEEEIGWPSEPCPECGGEGRLYWSECIGRCDKDGNHSSSEANSLGHGTRSDVTQRADYASEKGKFDERKSS